MLISNRYILAFWQGVLALIVSVVLLLCFSSCSSWHEAKAVIAMADSIDQTKHVIYDDTAALGRTIRCLDNPFGRVLMSNTLGKAYYYMGRNLSMSNQIAEAAECYIEADRLQIDDPVYRGRVNSCMGYICAQNNNDSLALIFYEQSNKAFLESHNDWYYAQSLLNMSYHHILLHQFVEADSLLQIAYTYSLNRAYRARYYETKGLYFYEQQLYDSALVYFNRRLNYWQSEEEKCFSYLKIMQVYFKANHHDSAVYYAQKIISTSENPNYISNAYYCMMEDAQKKNDAKLLSQYSYARTDALKLLRDNTNKYAEATPKLMEYLQHPHPWRWSRITIACFIILCIILIISIVIYRRAAITQIKVSNEQIVSMSAQIQKQTDELNEYNTQHFYDKHLDKIRRKYPKPLHQWNEYDQLKKDVNPYLHSWLLALEKLNLTQRENVLCVLSFIYPQMSIEDLANSMCITKDALMVRKTRLTKKIGITSAQLNSFLQKLSIAE
jgi:tetratricopeptide (TPR) repeat protein